MTINSKIMKNLTQKYHIYKSENIGKISVLSILTIIILLAFAFKKPNTTDIEIISIEKAINDKLIRATFQSNGNFSGKSIFFQMTNLKAKAYKITVPAGSYFKAPNSNEQDLIVPQEEIVVLKANESKSILLNGFCTNLKNKAPESKGYFSLMKGKVSKEMPKLLAFLKGKKFENYTIQDAIWSITNNSSVTNVSGNDEKAVTELRKELFKITGQKEEWYQSPQHTVMNDDRSINQETSSISGLLEYKTTKGNKIYTAVYSQDGEEKMKTNENTMQVSGDLSYKFKIEVKGWQKGTYKVKIVENSIVIKEYDFIV